MENRLIRDQQISASSNYRNYPPEEGRLNNDNYWATATANPSNPWIQVDLLDIGHVITGIQTQGSGGGAGEWVEDLRIQTGDSEDSLTFIMNPERNRPKVCSVSH